jgi:hypothetical protein
MPAIMADHDIEGQMQALLRLLMSPEWNALWTELAMPVESFASLGLSPSISDAALWQFCQTRQIILLTGNRNNDGPESLEVVLPGFCKSITKSDIEAHAYVLIPGRYVGAAAQEDDGELFEEKTKRLVAQLQAQTAQARKLDEAIAQNLRESAYE